MALVRVMLGTAQVYLEAGETHNAKMELKRALKLVQGMRPTRKARIMRAYIAQAIEAL